MKRRILPFFGFVLLAGAQTIHGQSNSVLPTRDQVKELLVKAYDQSNLWSDGSPAFHLHAKVKSYGPKGKAIEGAYELWWASEDRWREEMNWGGQTSSLFAAGNQLSSAGEDTHRADSARLKNVLRTWRGVYIDLPSAEVYTTTPEGSNRVEICIKGHMGTGVKGRAAPGTLPTQTICLEPGTGSLLEADLGDERWKFDGYRELATKRYPGYMGYFDRMRPLVTVEVDLLELLDLSQPALLSIPTGATSRSWCPNIVAPKPIHFGPPSMDFGQLGRERDMAKSGIAPAMPASYVDLGMVVFTVDERGHTSNVQAFLPGGPRGIDKSLKREMMLSTFQPATCHGNPVPNEFIAWK